MTKLEKTIDRLCREKGYPHQKLDHATYTAVLKEAHEICFPPKPAQVNPTEKRKFDSGNKHQWQDDWDRDEQGELNEEEVNPTPGTLSYFLDGDRFTIKDEENEYIASTYSQRGDDGGYIEENYAKELVRRYNAFPAMLEALKGLVKDVKSKPNDTRYATHIKIAEAAIQSASK